MRAMVERSCGLGVHQETMVACVPIGLSGVRPTKAGRTFATPTRALEGLRDWLLELGAKFGMESPEGLLAPGLRGAGGAF